jgi:hypothetical protein
MAVLGHYKLDNKEFMKHLLSILIEKSGHVLGEENQLPKNATVKQILESYDFPIEQLANLQRNPNNQ